MTAETRFESSRELAQKADMNKVLIVEDEHTIAEGVELYLRKEGFQTERAGDGKRALELLKEQVVPYSEAEVDLLLNQTQLLGRLVNDLRTLSLAGRGQAVAQPAKARAG